MKYQIAIWIFASLVMPALVALSGNDFNGLALVFWPGSIMLVSLGAEPRPFHDVAYVWTLAAISNVVLYLCIWFIALKLKSGLKQNE